MWQSSREFLSHFPLGNAVSTLALIAVLLIVRALTLNAIRRWNAPSAELRRRWIVQVRNATLLAFLVGLIIIWAAQIKEVAISLLAVAVAVVLATKELIICLTGGIIRTVSHRVQIGSRIEIGGHRGDVIDMDPMTTTLLEIGPGQHFHQYTGRAVTIPNSQFLSSSVVNETYTEKYVVHVFAVPLTLAEDWRAAEERLLEAALAVCSPYLEEARRYMEEIGRKEGVEPPTLDPRISVVLPEPGKITLLARVPVPAKRKGRTEQEIMRKYLELTGKAGQGETA
jgi:small-conductance mechanosensitive channel